MFVPPQYRGTPNPPTSRAVVKTKRDGSVELCFPDVPDAEPIPITRPTRLAIRERQPNAILASEGPAAETPAHGNNSKKRTANSQSLGDFEDGMHDSKREDNGTHDDKTVSMDEYWKAKAADMNIDVEGTEFPQGTDKSGLSAPYEGSVSGIPPLRGQAVGRMLMRNNPNHPGARAWAKAQEAADFLKKQAMEKEKEKETLSPYEALIKGEPPKRVSPLIARINEMEKSGHWRKKRGTKQSASQRIAAAEKMQNEKMSSRASIAQTGSSKSAAPTIKKDPIPRGPSMDHDAVRKVLAEVRAKEAGLTTDDADEASAESAAEPAAEASAPANDIPLELAKKFMEEREFQAGVIDSLEGAQHRLLKNMYGYNYPKPKKLPLPFELNEPRPAGGFADWQKEKAWHTAFIDHVEQARLRLEGTMGEMRDMIAKNRMERMKAEEEAANDDLSDSRPSTPDDQATEPMGIHRTPDSVEKMEKEREGEQEREIDPEAMKRVQDATVRLQRAMFGDELPNVNYKNKRF